MWKLGVVVDERGIAERYRVLRGVVERAIAAVVGGGGGAGGRYGGIAAVVRATGISESTVMRGLADLDGEEQPARAGPPPGRRSTVVRTSDPGLVADLERLVDPATRGDPESPLRWTSKSGAKLAEALRELGHEVVDRTVLQAVEGAGVQPAGEREDAGGCSASRS